MYKHSIGSVISFCTNEARFLRACVEQCRLFSTQIIVAVCDHFFDGTEENRELLEQIYKAFPDCLFVEYPFAVQRIPKKVFDRISFEHFWHSASRALGLRFLDEEIERVLFLDADEVPDGKRFFEWLQESDYAQHTVLKLSNYWYFREARFRAEQWEDSIVLAHRGSLDLSVLLHEGERNAIYDLLPGPKRRKVVGCDSLPMFHHFSWVRTKEEMLRKVETWGHRNDRDWKSLVEQEFAGEFGGKDFIHGYTCRECNPFAVISMDQPSFAPDLIGRPQLFRIEENQLAEWLDLPMKTEWQKLFTRIKGKFHA